MMPEIGLRDLVYFDFEKAASIYSQIEGGLLKETQTGIEGALNRRYGHKLDLKVYELELGRSSSDKTSQLESRVLHHDLLTRTESKLGELGLAIDLNSQANESNPTPELIRSKLAGVSYFRVEGWSVIEDYSRFYEFTKCFNDLSEFLGRCSLSGLELTEEYKQLLNDVESFRSRAASENDRNRRIKLQDEARGIESKFREYLRSATGLGPVEEWLLAGLRLFIDTFVPERIDLRIFPFESLPEFQVIANLKKECFVDGDLENVLFAYGTRPNVKLTAFGLITSLPTSDGVTFNPWNEVKNQASSNDSDEVKFEAALRGVFSSMEGLQKFVRFARYPNVTIYPIAVYRSIRTLQKSVSEREVRSGIRNWLTALLTSGIKS